MNNIFNNQGRVSRSGKIIKVMTPAMFFGAEGQQPVFQTRQEFLNYGEQLRPNEANGLKTFLYHSKLRVRSDGNLDVRKDAGEKDYVYPRFQLTNSNPGCKIVLEADLLRFLTEYFDDQFAIGFDLDELIEEARKAN